MSSHPSLHNQSHRPSACPRLPAYHLQGFYLCSHRGAWYTGLNCTWNFNLFFFFFFFLGPYLWHMEVPRLGVESELQLLAYATAPAMQDP